MVDILDEVIPSAVEIISIIIIFFWVFPDKILPALSKINGSEILSYIIGILLIIAVIVHLILSKK